MISATVFHLTMTNLPVFGPLQPDGWLINKKHSPFPIGLIIYASSEFVQRRRLSQGWHVERTQNTGEDPQDDYPVPNNALCQGY